MSEPRPHPEDYIRYAIQFHRAGKGILDDLDKETPINPQIAVSIGLFLQAIELLGKSILRATGMTQPEIITEHRWHDLHTLISAAQDKVREIPELQSFHDFVNHDVSIFAYQFRDGIDSLLRGLSERDVAGKPRNYFYPDHHEFTALEPPGLNIAIERMTHKLIEDASEIARILKWDVG